MTMTPEGTLTLSRSKQAAQAWGTSTTAHRLRVLARAAELYDARRELLATTMATEMGKPIVQGRAEIASCVRILRYYAEHGAALLHPDPIDTELEASVRVELAPIGVVLGIMPWNYPHYQLIRVIAPNLLLGNAVLFKHASICRESARLVAEIFAEAGAPSDVVVNSRFSHEEVFDAIAAPEIAAVSFTGGEIAGAAIASAAGAALKKVVLELGGNDPFIVFDADRVEELALLVSAMRLSNAGQTCVSPKRIIVRADLLPRFLAAFTPAFLTAVPGDPTTEACALGPLASEAAAAELREILRRSVAEGVEVQGDTAELDRVGRNFAPLLVLNPDRQQPVWRQELFGPIAVVASAQDADEAIELANDSEYGLGATVYTNDPGEAHRFVRELHVGMVAVNGGRGGDPRLPFGGVGRSGFGRELGVYGLREFANQKLVVEHLSAAASERSAG